MKICIGGDFYVSDEFSSKVVIADGIQRLFSGSDLNLLNLESPILETEGTMRLKTGPCLKGSVNSLDLLKFLNISGVTLANNHIMDYGEVGLESTLGRLKAKGIRWVGVGKNLMQARDPLLIEKDGESLAIVNFAENEWGSATRDRSGFNSFDLVECSRQIVKAKEQNNFVGVVIHGGHEYFNLPSPRMVKEYRYFAEMGASFIVAHHTHSYSGYEIYNGVPIFYGLGNFIFTLRSNFLGWYTGLCLTINLNRGMPVEFEVIPIRQARNSFCLDLLEGEDRNDVLLDIQGLNNIILNEDLLERSWISFLEKQSSQYLGAFNPLNNAFSHFLFRVVRKMGFGDLFLHARDFARYINYIRCESHRDALLHILERKLK